MRLHVALVEQHSSTRYAPASFRCSSRNPAIPIAILRKTGGERGGEARIAKKGEERAGEETRQEQGEQGEYGEYGEQGEERRVRRVKRLYYLHVITWA